MHKMKLMKYVEKHWKRILIGIAIVTVLFILVAQWRKYQVLKNSTETTLGNSPRNDTGYDNTFYYDQLTDREKAAYETLKTALDEFRGGVVTFPEAINGREYTRITHALEYGTKDYFYSIIGIPMTADNQSLTYNDQDILAVEDNSIEKCVLFLSCAEDVDRQGEFDEEGYVTNLDEMEEPLGNMVDENIEAIKTEQQEINTILDQIVSEMPSEYGAKEATDYFLAWMKENLTAYQESASIDTMSGLFEQVYKCNGLSCVLEEKALPTAYAKLLAELCNRAGIRSHVVLGQWKDGKAYVMTCVEIDGRDIYVDASEGQTQDLWGQKYLTKQETTNMMSLADYFNYDE